MKPSVVFLALATAQRFSDFRGTVSDILKVIDEKGFLNVIFPNGELVNHPKKDTLTMFYETVSQWDNGVTLIVRGEKTSCEAVNDLLEDNEIPIFETLSKDLSRRFGIIVTDQAIYEYEGDAIFDREGFVKNCCLFRNAYRVECSYDDLKFYDAQGQELSSVWIGSKGDVINGTELAQVLTRICRLSENVFPTDFEEGVDENELMKAARAIVWDAPNRADSHYQLGSALYYLFDENSPEIAKEALVEFNKAIDLLNPNESEDKEHIALCKYRIASIYDFLNNQEESRKCYIQSLDGINAELRHDAMKELIELEGRMKDSWNEVLSLDYLDRKFIMPIKDNGIGGCVADNIAVYRISNIPSCIKFPTGHPVANQLYIGHPYKPSLYVPYEQSEELFFLDKVHEFRYLLECLGAEEISITSIKGKDVSEFSDSNNRYAVDGEIKRFSAGVEVNTQYKNQNDSSSHSHRSMIVKLDPLQRPFLPDGLIWYNEMPQWQRLVQSRLHGNLLEYSEFVSTAETKFTSSSEMTDIKASAKFLWAKAHAEVNECFEKQFKESIETQWKVDVKFRSMKGFENQMSDTIKNEKVKPVNQVGWSKEEENYAEEVKFCLEDDGVIDDSERRLLERKRIKFGISQKRAAEIENSLLQSQLTEDEQEYLEAVKEELVGGKIPEASRRLLERLRKRMDVSDERAKEIEIMAMKR